MNFLDHSEADLKFLIRNVNTYGDLSQTYKDDKDYKILSTLLYNIKYPLYKDGKKGKNFLIWVLITTGRHIFQVV